MRRLQPKPREDVAELVERAAVLRGPLAFPSPRDITLRGLLALLGETRTVQLGFADEQGSSAARGFGGRSAPDVMGRKTFREIVKSLASSQRELRGSVKLRAALDHFGVPVDGRIALDVGAATGGFTTVLLERGASKVYAVDAGHGQLLGSLRQDSRVVNLEATNIAQLTDETIPDHIELITVDVSYLPLRRAMTQLLRVPFADGSDLVGLVKPMFELQLATAPSEPAVLQQALEKAVDGVTAAGWRVLGTMDSPVTGAKGAPELFIHATWETG